jgi:hypothetical protein
MKTGISLWKLLLGVVMLLWIQQASAGPFDSIPIGAGERVVMEQDGVTVQNGSSSNLYLPGHVTVMFDYDVEPGKQMLLMVITEAQWQAVSAGEQVTTQPMLRVTVSGTGTQTVELDGGTYVVAMLPVDNQYPFEMSLRTRARE